MFTTRKSRVLSGSALLVAVAVALGLAINPVQDDAEAADDNGKRIGTYNPELVFQQYHGINELIALSQRLEQEFQEAQMAGDQARLMQLQQEMQESQMRIVEQFHDDVERIMPEVAQANDLDIVAIEIVYKSDEYSEPQDISQHVADRLAEEAPESEPAPADPFGQPGGFDE